MEFSKEAQIERIKPSLARMLAHLQKKNISFSPIDADNSKLENVIFSHGDKVFKMAHHSLYRYSGIAVICVDKGENLSETKEVTDDMYMNIFIRPIIENQFGLK